MPTMKSLDAKLSDIHSNPSNSRAFLLADAKDADMAWGIASPGEACRSMPAFREQIRQIVSQGIVDVMLASVSTMDLLAREQRLFEGSSVTPAVRANDSTDIWCPRGGRYQQTPSLPFATTDIEAARSIADLGLYSVTFNNDPHVDRETLLAFKTFRTEAQSRGFRYFLEVFAPNVSSDASGLSPEQTPAFINDMIVRTLAGAPRTGWPLFLKIPYFGPRWMEELTGYDSTLVVGILGGSSGTTYDAFKLLSEARKYGARAALFGRKIKDADDPLAFIAMLRRIAEETISSEEAVDAYHAELGRKRISPKRSREQDSELTAPELSYLRRGM
jgi:hypothetical protein